uniref:Uncharacterized protein AlNc14C34G3055 n=1 Tax=Albugo laibachii Nc14 TaxID=890382 RepID=F0W8C4_9STRA|nr:conserved hypothetical protein [Albugo laibachii Nc14]|eukprot:CCA17379.1 conserved hypothetical protein [Albugo laibachii Nc14]
MGSAKSAQQVSRQKEIGRSLQKQAPTNPPISEMFHGVQNQKAKGLITSTIAQSTSTKHRMPIQQRLAIVGSFSLPLYHCINAQVCNWVFSREISKMLTIIEKQRQELDHRDDARQQALKVADTFADAIRQFEERLHCIETRTANDVSEIRQLLQRQASVSEQILLSLNLPSRPSQLMEEAVVSPSKR